MKFTQHFYYFVVIYFHKHNICYICFKQDCQNIIVKKEEKRKRKMSCHLKNNVVISAALFSVLLLPSSLCSVQDETETCERDSCVAKPANCKIFDPKNFGPKNKTIIYGEARGRIGNQLLGKLY